MLLPPIDAGVFSISEALHLMTAKHRAPSKSPLRNVGQHKLSHSVIGRYGGGQETDSNTLLQQKVKVALDDVDSA